MSARAALAACTPGVSRRVYVRLELAIRRALRSTDLELNTEELARDAQTCGEFLAAAYAEDCAALGVRVHAHAQRRAFFFGAAIALEHALSRTDASAAASVLERVLRAANVKTGRCVELFSVRASRTLQSVARDLDGHCDGYRPISPLLELAHLYEELLRASIVRDRRGSQLPRVPRARLQSPIDALTYARRARYQVVA